ncbi:MAG: ABC transporter ATP-binding protein [Dehalococcoidia bacterium]|nr:ABC transporter ATP-binding protein [Dehalococcoidia bacterium]
MSALLEVNDLHVYFDTPQGVVRANNGVSLQVQEGESLGIMGESGCGKTVLFLALLRLQQPGRIVSGSVVFDKQDITRLSESEVERIRGRDIALVPQNHATALNPAYTVRQQLAEAMSVRDHGGSVRTLFRLNRRTADGAASDEVRRVFRDLGFTDDRLLARLLQSYPHELSGGMRQRVLLAMGLLLEPRVLVADEPTTALDRATRAQSLEMLRKLNGKLTMLVVSHDLQAIENTCSRVAVMYAGRIVECGPVREVLREPRHPYSRLLIAAQSRTRGVPLADVFTDTSDLIEFPSGCPFHPICSQAMPQCSDEQPLEHRVNDVSVSCHLYGGEGAPC